MGRTGRIVVAASVLLVAGFAVAPSAHAVAVDVTGGHTGGMWDGWDNGNGGWNSQYYYVCQVKSVDGSIAFEAMTSIECRDRTKELPALYREALSQWSRDKKEAQKAGEKFTEKKPAPPAVKKGSRSYREKAEAVTAAEKLQAKWDEELARRRTKEEEKANKAGGAG